MAVRATNIALPLSRNKDRFETGTIGRAPVTEGVLDGVAVDAVVLLQLGVRLKVFVADGVGLADRLLLPVDVPVPMAKRQRTGHGPALPTRHSTFDTTNGTMIKKIISFYTRPMPNPAPKSPQFHTAQHTPKNSDRML